MLDGLDSGVHYSALARDDDGNIVEVVWNYERDAGDPWHGDDFTSRAKSERRRELAVDHQQQGEHDEDCSPESRQTTVVTDGGTETSNIEETESNQLQGRCNSCGRSISDVADECADCLVGDAPTTLADFGGDRDV
jgi:hypothetical protein